MTPEQHNKYVGVAHLVYAGLYSLIVIGFLFLFGALFIGFSASPETNDAPPPFVFLIFWLLIAAFYGAFTIPSFIAGYALLKRKRWAKVASFISAVLAAMFFPIGTAICVYTIWFLFSEPGKLLYDRPAQALPPAPPPWLNVATNKQTETHYVPPSAPPNWR